MAIPMIRSALAVAAALTIGACTGDGYGYDRVAVGYYGADPYFGWYNDYYYPGVGYYVYDHDGGRRRWDDGQRRYWQSRGGHQHRSETWTGYHGPSGDHRPPSHPRGDHNHNH